MRQLLAGEQAIRTARQHWSVFVPAAAVGILVLVVVVVIVAVLPGDVGGRDLHTVKVAIVLAACLVVAVALTLRYLRWRFTTFVLTNHRVVVSRGVLSRYMESIALDRIQDVSVTQGLAGRIFRAGSVEIESAGRDGSEVLRDISNPVAFSNDLQYAAEARRTGQPFAPSVGGVPAPFPAAPASGAGEPGYRPPGAAGYVPPPPGYNPPHGGV